MRLDDSHVREAIRQTGPLATFQRLIAENNALIRRPELGNGRAITNARTVIYTGLMAEWAAEQQRNLGYDKPFAVVALGGTGRGEMSPYSDDDFAFLFDGALEGNQFLLELQRQTLTSGEFKERNGFEMRPYPFSLDDVPNLKEKQLNSFLDMRPVHDPHGLAELFRERIRATFDSFEHFLHVRGFWKDQWEKAATESERLDAFDIKNDGLRVFLAGIWTLAGKGFQHSLDIYETLDDPRDLEAYDFLMRIRGFIHSRHTGPKQGAGGGNHPEDILNFDDFNSFGELLGSDADDPARFEFANHVRARLLSARRRVAGYARGVIERELKKGREVSPGNPIVYGVGGLHRLQTTEGCTPQEKSRAAMTLLVASQRYGVPIDPSELQTTFRNAGDWLMRRPELSALFHEQRGSLAGTFAFLAQIDGAQDRLFPGYAKFEASFDARVMAERQALRGALEREKLMALEKYVHEGREALERAVSAANLTDPTDRVVVEVEAALLDAEQLSAIKLALKTKRLSLTAHDLGVRFDTTRPLHERFSSGLSEVPLTEYYEAYSTECDFPREEMRLVEFLVNNQRTFVERARDGITDARLVELFAQLCQDENRLRALFVFTYADHCAWESEKSEPFLWFNIREIYRKTLIRFRGGHDATRSLAAAGYSPEQLAILKDFGVDFFEGGYSRYANKFGSHLVRLEERPESTGARVVALNDGTSTIIGVSARDYRGLAATISGALWHNQLDLRQAHLFSAMNYRLALDFFHIGPREKPLTPDTTRAIENAIKQQLYITDEDEARLPKIAGDVSLREWRPGLHCLRFETTHDTGGLVYALTYKIFRHLRGNIFGLTAHATRGRAYVSVYHSLPPDLSLEHAQAIAMEKIPHAG